MSNGDSLPRSLRGCLTHTSTDRVSSTVLLRGGAGSTFLRAAADKGEGLSQAVRGEGLSFFSGMISSTFHVLQELTDPDSVS